MDTDTPSSASLQALLEETRAAQKRLVDAPPASDADLRPQPGKRALLQEFLDRGRTLQVQVDASCPHVDVPEHLRGRGVLLNFCRRFLHSDIVLTDCRLEQTLSFNGRPYHVTVPLEAVVAARVLAAGEDLEFRTFDADGDPVGGDDDNDDPRGGA